MCPAHSENWSALKKLQDTQWSQLERMKQRQADFQEVVTYMRTLPHLPETISAFEQPLIKIVNDHNSLYGKDRHEYRAKFFDVLPYRRYLNYADKTLKKKGEWNKLQRSITEVDAEVTRSWTWRDFLIESLNTECICQKRKKVWKPGEFPVDMEDYAEHSLVYGDKLAHEIRNEVSQENAYQACKRGMKYKNFREQEEMPCCKLLSEM